MPEGRAQKANRSSRKLQLHAHHWLILHGRYTCVARKHKCAACLIRDLCEFKDKNL